MSPTSWALSMMSWGQVPSLSYSHATGRISFSAKSWASSRRAFCSSVSVKSTIEVLLENRCAHAGRTRVSQRRLTGQSMTTPEIVAEDPAASSTARRTSQFALMQDAFAIVLVVVLVGAVVAAVWAGLASRNPYGQIGRGGLSLDEPARPAVAPSFAVAAREREAEIRQMLEARNARRVARGQE